MMSLLWLAVLMVAVCERCIIVAEITRTFSVSELTETDSRVGFVEGGDEGLSPDRLAYMLVFPPESGVRDAFSVSPYTGEIKTKHRLDYELQSSYVFLAIPADGSEGIRVTVNVIDENDNAPTFPVPSFDVKLSEYAKLNAEVPLVSASDPDSGIYSVQRYRIVSGNINNAFRLSTRQLHSVLYLDLVVNGELDREFRDSYQLSVEAIDGGDPPKTGRLLVNVTIVDANDNAPEFTKARYSAKISKNVTVGTKVLSVKATDRDVGPNARITYKLLPVPSNVHKRFSIDSNTGVITVSEPLSTYQQDNYELIVVASDTGIQPLESTAFVTITMSNAARYSSDIKLLFLSSDGSPTVAENAALGSFVARLSVSDDEHTPPPTGDRSNLTLTGHMGHFQLRKSDRNVYVLVVATSLDRETVDSYSLKATWFGADGRVAERRFELALTDVNDNYPRFTRNSYEAQVRESAANGTSVIQLTATDLDDGENGRVSYAIANSSSFAHWFSIDAETGLITSTDAVDCELSSRPELMVVATDHGSPPLSAMAKVVVNVLDFNDNAPLFQRSVYTVQVAENENARNCFLKVHAFDRDCGLNSQISYSIPEDAVEYTTFSIDSQSGTVCLKRQLDYETKKWHQFPVVARDGGGLSGSATVRVNVGDVDDNSPVFYPSSYNVSVREGVSPGVPLATLSATDADDGVYGKLTYSIVDTGPDALLFRIDPDMGELYVKGLLETRNYQLRINATDGGGRTSAVSAYVGVSVLPRGYPSPMFEQRLYRFSVTEDTLPSIEIGAVRATGPGLITYSIYSGDPNGWFVIDRTTGAVSVKKDLDGDKNSSLLLNIQAAVGDPPSYNHTQVIVEIEDVNDNAPYFETKTIRTSVAEDHPLNTALFTVQATDNDRGRNADLTYQLVTVEPPEAPFLVRPRTGEIIIINNLDFEKYNKSRLTIMAADGGIPPKTANVTVYVDILDVNDHAPVFDSSTHSITIAEDEPVLSKIWKLTATDKDTAKNGQLSYSLVDSSDGRFGIHGDSGWIYVRKQLDRETVPLHRLVALARDHGTPPQEATVKVLITLTDVNDNAPSCVGVSKLFVNEHRPPNVLIGYINAFDPDQGDNGTINYEVEGNDRDTFRIKSNGEVYAVKALDAEIQATYRLSVLVSDAGQPPRSGRCVVEVHVNDENDNAPFFVLPHQNRFFVREQQPIGTEIVQVRANDPDKGPNGTITYAIANPEGLRYFKISETDGVISTATAVDYNELPQKELRIDVVAMDKGKPSLSSTKTLFVEILEVANSKSSGHTKEQKANATITFEVSESVPVGTKLGPIDAERAAKLLLAAENTADETLLDTTFDITGGNTQALFAIDRLSSDLYLIKPLDYETTIRHSLRVQKTDLTQSKSPLKPAVTVFDVRVAVSDENDNVPVFPQDPVTFSTPEGNTVGRVIWRYNATDADMGANGRIKYSIVEQSPEAAFDLDPVTGELWITSELDRERFDQYLVVTAATDQAADPSQRRTARATTHIYITDANDNRPTFQSSPLTTVFEDEPAGGATPFFHVVATDPDFLQNGLVGYSLSAGNELGYFQLNRTTGALALKRRLGRDSPKRFSLEVTAYDHGTSSLSTTQRLIVNVRSVNMDGPRFLQSVWNANVSENVDGGTVVVKLLASDNGKDGRSKGTELLFAMPKGEGSDVFVIDELSGIIETAVPLDRENKAFFSFTVYVHDKLNHGRYDVATVEVTVIDRNDNTPVIAEASCLPLSLVENRQFTSFHKIIATDADDKENSHLRYTIEGGNVDGHFHLNLTTGELSCDRLDWEIRHSYELTVRVTDGGRPSLSATCTLSVSVLDENDSVPAFTRELYQVEVNEVAPTGTTILRLSATSTLSAVANRHIVYSIVDNTGGFFEVNPQTGDLYTVRKLDYEKQNRYSIIVRATDQSSVRTERTSETKVDIRVTDTNDHAPVFTHTPFRVKIKSRVQAGRRIVKVLASDSDSRGSNSDIYYSFQRVEEDFSINPQMGVISAKRELTFPPGTVRYIGIFASDQGAPPMKTAGVVELTVESTLITAVDPSSLLFRFPEEKFSISENNGDGVTVGEMPARRYGSDDANGIEYAIIGGNEEQIFKIDKWTGRIHVARGDALDYERQSIHRLVIEASALPTPGSLPIRVDQHLAYATAIVEVKDANDNVPRFLQSMYATAVPEGQPQGAFVVQISASDEDQGENSQLTYSIVRGNLDSAFTIDETGTIRTSAELDREILDKYSLTVMATDSGHPPLSGETEIKVTVTDRNDNVPSFPPLKNVSLSEDTPPGALIAVVTANDVDSTPTLEYRLIPTGDLSGDGTFAVDRYSGRITLQTSLNYEQRNNYRLEIEVTDQVHSTVATMWVLVQDSNDNWPVFEKNHYQVSLPEDSPAGASIMHVIAHDPDSGNNGFITYSFASVDGHTPTKGFRIDEKTGAIFTKTAVDEVFGRNSLVRLTVEARDSGKPSKAAYTSVVVHVVSRTKQRQPKLSQQFFTFAVPENAPLHSAVGRLTLTPDTVDYPGAIYSINSGNVGSRFRLTEDGTILLQRALDREDMEEHRLTVSVVTKTNSISNSTATVLIKVEDVNDNAPRFPDIKHKVMIDDSTNVGDTLLRLTATDQDMGDNGSISYEITSGNEQHLFTIDSRTGVITLAKNPIEAGLFFSGYAKRLVVKATDGGTPSKQSITTVKVLVSLSNGGGPFFPVHLYFEAVPENAPEGTLVFTAKAATSDERLVDDKSQDSGLKYSLTSVDKENAVGMFQINEINGEVRTTGFFDYETKTDYRFAIRVADSVGRSNEAPAHVLIKGVDEYSPKFSQKRYTFRLSHDAEPGTRVGVIYATDKDEGSDKQFRFALQKPSIYFEINEFTGVITVRQSLKPLTEHSEQLPLRLIRSATTTDDAMTAQLVAKKDDLVMKTLYLTVIAASSFNSLNPKTNSALVEIQLGDFPPVADTPGKVGATIITVTSGFLVLLLILVLLCLFLMLRRRQTKTAEMVKPTVQYTTEQIAYQRANQPPLFTSSNNRGIDVFHELSKSPERRDLPPPPMPPVPHHGGGNQSLRTGSNKFIGRGGVPFPINRLSTDEDEEMRRMAVVTEFDEHHVTSMPDSGIDPEDDATSLASADYPSAQEYLTSLGVTDTPCSCPQHDAASERLAKHASIVTADLADAAEDPEVKELIYSKVNEVLSEGGGRRSHHLSPPPINFLSSPVPGSPIPAIMNRSLRKPPETIAPSYQPLTQVFSEIAKLKTSSGVKQQPTSLPLSASSHYHSTPVATPQPWGAPTFQSPLSPTHNNNSKSSLSRTDVEIKI